MKRLNPDREAQRAAAARRARELGPPRLPKWPPGKPKPEFASEAEEAQFLRSYDFSAYWEGRAQQAKSDRLNSTPLRKKPREHVYRLRLTDSEMSALRARAIALGVPVSAVLRDLIRTVSTSPAGPSIAIEPHPAPALVLASPDEKPVAAFAHLRIINNGPPVRRVRCWLRFFRKNDEDVFSKEMPGRWTWAPEPFTPVADGKFVFDFSKVSLGYTADFARREDHAVAVAIKYADGSCWGWPPDAYQFACRHPVWQLPSESLRVRARIVADGHDHVGEFILDTSVALDNFAIHSSHNVVPISGTSAAVTEVDSFQRSHLRLAASFHKRGQ